VQAQGALVVAVALSQTVRRDAWLDRWLPGMKARADILELGCDDGRDTAYLVERGFRVVATDVSQDALRACARTMPNARFVCHDLREPFPFRDAVFEIVVASLCLHYFEWERTQRIAAELRRCLADGGPLFCRLNSTRDVNFGAVGHHEIEPNFFAMEQRFGNRKRFFDRAAIGRLFARGWAAVSVEEKTIDRYEKPKVVWEVVLRKARA
jgi:SAM-dependent methyltransferase